MIYTEVGLFLQIITHIGLHPSIVHAVENKAYFSLLTICTIYAELHTHTDFILSRRRSSCPVVWVTHSPVFNSFTAMIHATAVNKGSVFFLFLSILPPAIVPSLLTHLFQSSQHPMLSSNCTPSEMPWQMYGHTFFIFRFTCCRLMMIAIDNLLLFILQAVSVTWQM